jgi:transglutaminase-like putative cysteine protease
MKVSTFHFIATCICSALAVLLVASSEAVPVEAALWAAVLCGWSFVTQWDWRRSIAKPPKILFWFTLLAFCTLGFVGYRDSKDIITILVWFLLGLLPLFSRQALEEKQHWSYFTVLGILSLVAFIATENFLSFLIFLGLAPLLLVWLNASHLRFHLTRGAGADERLPQPYFVSLTSSIFAGLAVGALVFFLFPRSFQWQNPFALRGKDTESGYTGKIELGAVNIQMSSKTAFVVETPDKNWLAVNGPGLYFRANVLDRFDGRSWSNSKLHYSNYISSKSVRQTSAYVDRVVPLRIYRETHSTRAILYPGVLREIQLPRYLRGQLRVDGLRNLERSQSHSIRYAYDVGFSPLESITEELSRPGAHSGDWSDSYLEVPKTVADTSWFKSFIRESLPAKGSSYLEVARRVAGYFQSGFRAGYQGESTGTTDLETFLSKTRYGHCEYFATAGVLALRAAGIPARIVLGYRGGAFNPVSGVLEVRESEAHAWAEMHVEDMGWIPLDPTPVIPLVTSNPVLKKLTQFYSAFRFRFERYFVDYNLDTQRAVFADLKIASDNKSRKFPWRAVAVLFIAIFSFGGLYSLIVRKRSTHIEMPKFWTYFERQSRRRGVSPRLPGESFRAFALRASAVWPGELSLEAVDTLERLLYRADSLPAANRRQINRTILAKLAQRR